MFETILSDNVCENITDKVLDDYIEKKAPKIVNPSFPQIPGYIYDGSKITKPSDENFAPISVNSMKINLLKQNIPKDVLMSITSFLKKKYSKDFCKVLCLSITGTSDTGNGFEASLRNTGLANFLHIIYPFKENDAVYLYINWEVIFYTYGDIENDSSPQKMSDLTIDKTGNRSNSQIREQVKEKEEGESLVTFSKNELDNLVSKEIAEVYLAIKSLGKVDIYPVENNKSKHTSFTKSSVVVESGEQPSSSSESTESEPQYITKTPTVSSAAKDKINQTKKQTEEMIKSKTNEVKEEFNKMKGKMGSLGDNAKNAAKEEITKIKEDYKRDLKELRGCCEDLYFKAKDFIQRLSIDLPSLSIVTTPTGPGVAINAIKAQLSNLRDTGSSMKASIERIEVLTSKLKFDLLASKIPEIGKVSSTIKNVISLAKAAISSVGI